MKITSQKPQKSTQNSKKPAPSGWQNLINSLLRPPRMRYNESHMGYKTLKLNNQIYNRIQETIIHQGRKKIFLSMFVPENGEEREGTEIGIGTGKSRKKVILYLHGNSSSKVESKNLLGYLGKGWALAAFDFIGCGNNMEEDVITLGYRQARQVETVVEYLKSQNYIVVLWGRSMGAVSALLYGKSEIIIADSPFRSMKKLCKQLSKHKINPIPNILIDCLFPCIFHKLRTDIKNQGQYDLEQLNIEKAVKNINKNSLLIFLCGNQDDLVHYRNSEKLFEVFQGRKKYLEIVAGDHNSRRPDQVMRKIMGIVGKEVEGIGGKLEVGTEGQTGYLYREQIDLKLQL